MEFIYTQQVCLLIKHESLAQGVIWANLKRDETQFFYLSFLWILGVFSVFFKFVVFVFKQK